MTLHGITGAPRYLDHACRFADHLIGLQQADGTFRYPEFWDTHPPDNPNLVPNIRPQFALWIARVRQGLEIELLRRMNQDDRTTVITATHDQKMLDVSDRIIWLKDGQIERIESRADLEISVGQIRHADGHLE